MLESHGVQVLKERPTSDDDCEDLKRRPFTVSYISGQSGLRVYLKRKLTYSEQRELLQNLTEVIPVIGLLPDTARDASTSPKQSGMPRRVMSSISRFIRPTNKHSQALCETLCEGWMACVMSKDHPRGSREKMANDLIMLGDQDDQGAKEAFAELVQVGDDVMGKGKGPAMTTSTAVESLGCLLGETSVRRRENAASDEDIHEMMPTASQSLGHGLDHRSSPSVSDYGI